jgi:recombination protein RecT
MALDGVLKIAEEKRLKKSEKFRAAVPLTWQYVNMPALARAVVSAARIGWDPLEKNHVHLIPYLNGASSLYDIGFIPGYRGLELKSMKYGLDVPSSVTVELVFKNDTFVMFKKDLSNKVEGFTFQITNPFDRGEMVGGFYYHAFESAPEKNKLVVMSMKDILKRKPKYASPEFWGGEKDKWEGGKKNGTEKVDGWFEEMCLKTVKRAAYGNITIDSQKIDDEYQSLQQNEAAMIRGVVEADYQENANQTLIEMVVEPPQNVNTDTGEITQPEVPPGPSSEEMDSMLAAQEQTEAPY